MHNAIAYHLVIDAQPSPKQRSLPPWPTPLSLSTERDVMVWNIPLARLGQLSWLCPLPASCVPPHWQSMGSWKVLDYKHYL